MFKCEVTKVGISRNFQETLVYFKIGDKGSGETPNHKILEKSYHNRFIIGQVDRSIKVGDLLRCDGLPFIAKPAYSARTKVVKDSNNCEQKVTIKYNLPSGYTPFQLNSGYWVLRRK